MKSQFFSKLILTAILLFNTLISTLVIAQDFKNDSLNFSDFSLNNNHAGKDFYVSFHPTWAYYDSEYRIYVISWKNTTVTLETPGGTSIKTKNVKAFEPCIFTSKSNEVFMNWTGQGAEIITKNSYHISSTEPILVYVHISSKDYAGEGYQAIPTNALGTEYYNFSYYDYFYPGNSMYHPGGFIVIATEPKTNVTINLKGIAVGNVKTKGEKKIGETIKVNLEQGDTYMVVGGATTKGGQFDLTGSKITANKPIAVVSFHQFTCITYLCDNWGNYISEMLLPAQTWSKNYTTLNFTRKGNLGKFGDYFRVISSEDNCNFNVNYMDLATNKILGNQSGQLKKAGDFWEYFGESCAPLPVIRGISKWKSNKPFMVMQYSYSHKWDDDLLWQPVMIHLTPEEQFQKDIIFLAPPDFPSELTLIVEGDTNDATNKKLYSVNFDGKSIDKVAPLLFLNNIPGTNLYWVKFTVQHGVHVITSKTRLAGYLSRNRPSSYGWYIGMGLNRVAGKDTLPPVFSIKGLCGNYTCSVTEERNDSPEMTDPQKDKGISRLIFIKEKSNNFEMKIQNPEKLNSNSFIQKLNFEMNVIDNNLAGKAFIGAVDWGGNYIIDSVEYEPAFITFNTDSLDLRNCRLGNRKESSVVISNKGKNDIKINTKIQKNIRFSINGSVSDRILKPNEEIELRIIYNPCDESLKNPDYDTLVVTTECNLFQLLLKGNGVSPVIQAIDLDFGKVYKDSILCFESINPESFKITNSGTDTLTVFEITNVQEPFILKNPNLTFPVSVLPGKFITFSSICFNPKDTLQYIINPVIRNNSKDSLKTVVFKGKGYMNVTSVEEDWEVNIFDIPISDLIRQNRVNEPIKIDIYNMLGEWVTTVSTDNNFHNQQSIILNSNLPQGVYLIRIKGGTTDKTTKFMLIK